jgi:hypothetical protein
LHRGGLSAINTKQKLTYNGLLKQNTQKQNTEDTNKIILALHMGLPEAHPLNP